MSIVEITIQRLPHAPAALPSYKTDGAAGMDLCLAGNRVVLQPAERALLPTGFSVAIPQGYEGQLRLRSGFALQSGVILANSPGTIDSDYRGEIKVIVMNAGRDAVTIEAGERFAQLVICPVARCQWQEVAELPRSARDAGGFGSTGRH